MVDGNNDKDGHKCQNDHCLASQLGYIIKQCRAIILFLYQPTGWVLLLFKNYSKIQLCLFLGVPNPTCLLLPSTSWQNQLIFKICEAESVKPLRFQQNYQRKVQGEKQQQLVIIEVILNALDRTKWTTEILPTWSPFTIESQNVICLPISGIELKQQNTENNNSQM